MLKIYPAIIHNEDGSYWIEFPDLEGCNTMGDTLEDTMANAQEALGLYLASLEEVGQDLPHPSSMTDIDPNDLPAASVTSYIYVDLNKYRRSTKSVKKTLSLPEWLAEEAEKHHLSLSKVLQDGLKEKLGM